MELLVVLLGVGILAAVAVPAYTKISLRAQAAAALGDIHAVRVAALSYNTATNRWPPDVNRGITPKELEPYLGDGFSFDRGHYLLDWDNWSLPDGTPRYPDTGVLVGISLTTANPALGQAFLDLLGPDAASFTLDQHYTWILAAD